MLCFGWTRIGAAVVQIIARCHRRLWKSTAVDAFLLLTATVCGVGGVSALALQHQPIVSFGWSSSCTGPADCGLLFGVVGGRQRKQRRQTHCETWHLHRQRYQQKKKITGHSSAIILYGSVGSGAENENEKDTTDATTTASLQDYECIALRDRLGLFDRFDRWRFLQYLLDEESKAKDINQLLYWTLERFLVRPPPPSRSEGEEEVPPKRLERVRAAVREAEGSRSIDLLLVGEGEEDGLVAVEDSEVDLDVLETLEGQILPDAVEEEEAHKGTWDTVIELHGREAVKISQRRTPMRLQWRAASAAARVLLQYDFLLYGLDL